MAARDNCWLLVFNWPDGDLLKIVDTFCGHHYARCQHVFCGLGSPNQNSVRTAHRDIVLYVAGLPHSGVTLLMWPTNGQHFINTRWGHRTAGMLGQERTNERAGDVWENKRRGPSYMLCLVSFRRLHVTIPPHPPVTWAFTDSDRTLKLSLWSPHAVGLVTTLQMSGHKYETCLMVSGRLRRVMSSVWDWLSELLTPLTLSHGDVCSNRTYPVF